MFRLNSSIETSFETSFDQNQVDRFFSSVDWSIGFKPSVPPTFLTIFRKGEFELLLKLEIPVKKVLHGEQSYRFFKDLKVDTIYKGTTSILQHIEKKTRSTLMRILILETKIFENDSSILCAVCESTLIVKEELQ
jgi:hypothetical protein